VSRGSIIKRGSTYSIVLDLGRGPDGRQVRRWHSGYRTKKDAERARTELVARVDQGAYVEPSRLTLARVPSPAVAPRAGRAGPGHDAAQLPDEPGPVRPGPASGR
jgi:hypothetical protein